MGVDFEAVNRRDWLERVKAYPDPERNPAYKLLTFFEAKYDGLESRKTDRADIVSTKARAASPILNDVKALDLDLLEKYVQYLKSQSM